MSDAHSPLRNRQGRLIIDAQGRVLAPSRADVFAEAMVDMVTGPRQLVAPCGATPARRGWARTGQALFKVVRGPAR